jgi:hypothetical protein
MTNMDSADGRAALDHLAMCDDIIEAVYWLVHEEAIMQTVTPSDIAIFAETEDPDAVREVLEHLADEGLMEHVDGGYELSDAGALAGKRRFVDSFGHLEGGHDDVICGPDCWCQDDTIDESCHVGHIH